MVSVQTQDLDLSIITPLSDRTRKYVMWSFERLTFFRVYSDPDELRKKVDSFLLAFDMQEAEMRRKSREKIVDDDGFTLVQPQSNSMVSVPSMAGESKKRKSRAEDLTDFYRFQLKERKVAEWSDAKRREAKDRTKLNEMKNSNKFQL
jgi:ribosomal RNA-processing protein 7